MKQHKRVYVFSKEQYYGDWPPTDATEFVAWFSGKLEEIPAQYRSKAKIELDSVDGHYDSHYARIEIYYDRPETDDEMASREANERSRQDAKKERELQLLAELKAKYRL